MNLKDQNKLIKAGFMLVRPDDQPSPRIKIKDGKSTEWRTLSNFPSKAARDKKLKELLEIDKVIQD